MKKLLPFLFLLFLSIQSFAQDKILDFYAKDLNYCEKYLTRNYDFKASDSFIYTKEFNGVKIFYLYSLEYKRVTSIMIPYTSKEEAKVYEKGFDIMNKVKYNKTYWLIRSEKDNFLMMVLNDTKNNMFIIY